MAKSFIHCLCRKIVSAHDQRAQRELEEKEKELADKARAATFAQLRAKIESDIDILASRLPTKDGEAAEAAADQAYLKDRQLILGVKQVESFWS